MPKPLDDFEDIRRDQDPVRQGRRASELITLYQQRSAELARLRKVAIERAHSQGMSYTAIGDAFGLTKARIAQIRSSTQAVERVIFGVGPIRIGIPYRYRTTDRTRPLIAAEDDKTGDEIKRLLELLMFVVTRYQIEPDMAEPPPGDSIVVCGPKSAPIGANLMQRDPVLRMVQEDGRWWIEHRQTGQRYGSPSDDPGGPTNADVAYVARHVVDERVVVHIAGIHAIGSLGAAHYLKRKLAALFRQVEDRPFSLVVQAGYDGLTITGSELVAGPYVW